MMQNQNIQLPVSPTQVNGHAFNHNLPNGNDVWPALSVPQGMPNEVVRGVVVTIRSLAQSRATKTPVHCFGFNMLSLPAGQGAPWFSGPLFQQKCQEAVNFAHYLMLRQGSQPQHAAELAGTKLYLATLAQLVAQYPVITQIQGVDQATIQGIQQAYQEYQAICNDVNQFRMVMNAAPMGGVPVGNMAPSNIGISQYTVGSVAQAGSAPQANVGGSSVSTTGVYMGDEFGIEEKPKSWTAGQPLTQAKPAAPAPKPEAPKQATAQYEEHNFNAPQTVDDIVLDPFHYIPGGFEVDKARPFDRFRNPGGVEIRPAYQAKDWKRTSGDDQPYAYLVDPNRFIIFYAKWPDGRVKEIYVSTENRPEMSYLLHEIDEQRRAKAYQPKGEVVPSTMKMIDLDAQIQPIEKVKEQLDEGLAQKGELDPVILDTVFSGSSDMENEVNAREEVVQTLGLEPTDPVPAHEYVSTRLQALDIDDETFRTLDKLRTSDSMSLSAMGLKELIDKGKLSPRIVRFLNERLCGVINTYMKDSMGIEGLKINDFIEDAPQVAQYLAAKRGGDFGKVFNDSVSVMLNRGFNMAHTDIIDENNPDAAPITRYGVLDEYVNFQLSWSSAELLSLNINTEAVLVSKLTHPAITAVLRSMLERAKAQDILKRVYLRLITSDGVYYEVISGKMVQGALLLKKV